MTSKMEMRMWESDEKRFEFKHEFSFSDCCTHRVYLHLCPGFYTVSSQIGVDLFNTNLIEQKLRGRYFHDSLQSLQRISFLSHQTHHEMNFALL